MFQADVPQGGESPRDRRDDMSTGSSGAAGQDVPPESPSGEVSPLPPGAVDRTRLSRVLEAMDDDPWFNDEDFYEPTPEEEEEAFLWAHPELVGSSADAASHTDVPAGKAPDDTPSGAAPGVASGGAAGGAPSGNASADDEAPADELADEPIDRWVPDDLDDPTLAARWHPAARVPAMMPSVENMPGGAELATVLAAADVPRLGTFELVEFVAGCERVVSAMHALQARSVAELVRRKEMRPREGAPATVDPQRVAGLEVAARLARSGREGVALVARAEYLQSTLPDVFAAWSAGWLDTEKTDLIGRRLCRYDDEIAKLVAADVLPQAPDMTMESLRRLITRRLHKLAPKDAERRRREARQGRFVEITPGDDGMSWITAYVSAEEAAAVAAVLDAGARGLKRRDGDDGRTMGNRRADVLTSLAWAALAAGRVGGCPACRSGLKLTDAHGRAVTVNITVPATSLLGLDDLSAYLDGYGPVSASVARDLASGNAIWRRILTDPATGAVLDVGRTRYRPPAELAEHVLLRDVTCVWPGCEKPAVGPGVEIDHIVDWALGGVTADHNLGPFCQKHHVDKHQTEWQVVQVEPGRYQFVSATGHIYNRLPVQVGPIMDADVVAGGTDPPDEADPSDVGPPGKTDSSGEIGSSGEIDPWGESVPPGESGPPGDAEPPGDGASPDDTDLPPF